MPTQDRSLTGILDALIVKALATCLVNVFSISALFSSLIQRPLGGSLAVRISLAYEVGYHCFVEVLFYRKFVFRYFVLACVPQCSRTVLLASAWDIALIKFR